jgi:carboxypeptidase-like protein
LDATSDARGRFTITGILPGQYTVQVRTRSLDSMNAVHQSPFTFTDASSPLEVRVPSGQQLAASLCGKAVDHAGINGIIVGSVRLRGDSATASGVSGARVVAEWTADSSDSTKVRRTEVRSTSGGGFRFCGVPVNTTLTLSATTDSAETAEASVVRIPPNVRLARAELTLDPVDQLALRGAMFAGVVVSDSTREPIVGAEIAVADLGKSVVTDSRGAFKLTGIPAGEHQIVVRRIGYGAADTRVMFDGHRTVERRVVLGRAVTLETVTVTEKATERAMASFEENRRMGLGHFVTRGDLEKFTGMKLASVLQQIPQLDLRHGRGEQAWVSSRHVRPPLCPPGSVECYRNHGFYVPDAADAFQGMPTACYALVYLDDVLMNGATEPTEPFDISGIAPEQVEAVEFYSGPAQTPLKYSRMGSDCGVLVIWRRRSP